MKTDTLSAFESHPHALFWASFNSFEMRLPGRAVLDIAQPGDNGPAVDAWAGRVRQQVEADNFRNRPTPAKIRAELKEYGAWDADELADDEQNWHRLLWLAACGIAESDEPDCSEPL